MRYSSGALSSVHPIEESMLRLAEFFGVSYNKKRADMYATALINHKFDNHTVESFTDRYIESAETFPSFARVLDGIRKLSKKKSLDSGLEIKCPHKICDGTSWLTVDYGDGVERCTGCKCNHRENDETFRVKMSRCNIHNEWKDVFSNDF